MHILTVQAISKSFGALKAVDDVSLELKQNQTLAIVGESGCGKTTTARMIAGLIKPDTGGVKTGAAIQMVFQDPNSSLDPLFTVRRVLEESFSLQRSVPRGERIEKMKRVLKAVGLEEGMLGRFPHEFSGGQRQRIAIARAILANPTVLVLDEVTSGLDVLVQRQILDLLRAVKERYGLSYIFISHNLRVVKTFADTIMVMHRGKVVESGSVANVLNQPKMLYTQELVSAALTYRCVDNE